MTFRFQENPVGIEDLPLSISLYCPDTRCPNLERITEGLDCPTCGERAKEYHFFELQELQTQKRREAKLKETALFAIEDTNQTIGDKLEDYIRTLARLDAKKVQEAEDRADKLVVLGKIQALQEQLLFRELVQLTEALKRLVGMG